MFGSLFLPMWPWAMYKALSRAKVETPASPDRPQTSATWNQPGGPATGAAPTPPQHRSSRHPGLIRVGVLVAACGIFALALIPVAQNAAGNALQLQQHGVHATVTKVDVRTTFVSRSRGIPDHCELTAVVAHFVLDGATRSAPLA